MPSMRAKFLQEGSQRIDERSYKVVRTHGVQLLAQIGCVNPEFLQVAGNKASV